MKSKLIIVRSYPGSGKTTFVSKTFPNIFHLENDFFHYRNGEYQYNPKKQESAIQWCVDSAIMAMSRGMDVVVSNTFRKRKYIETYLKYAETFGYDVEIYRLMGEFKNIHNLKEDMVERFKNSMEDCEGEIFVYPKNDGTYELLTNKK